MASSHMLVVVAVLMLLRDTECYPSGAPTSTCSSMSPSHHSTPPQQSDSPFALNPVKPSVAPGSKLKLMLTSTTGTPFKGFILQARSPQGGDSAAIGQYTTLPNLTKTFSCAGGYQNSQNTVTHSDSSDRKNLEFEWEAPDYYEGPVVFTATVVQDFSTFWEGVKSIPVNVTKRSTDTSSQSSGISTTQQPVAPTTTTVPTVPTKPPRRESVRTDPIYEGCGSKKICFGSSAGCIDSKDCVAVVSCLVQGDEKFLFDMQARKSTYVAVGLSRDNKMGEDSVVECVNDGKGPNPVNAYMSWNFGKNNRRLKPQEQEGIQLKNSSFVNGNVYCRFERDTVTTVEGEVFNLATDQYNLLIAAGTSATGTNIEVHDVTKAAADTKQSLKDVSAVAVASNLLLKLHGAFMIASWIGAAGIGILLARYFKQTWVGSQLCGKDQWFAWHRMFMILTWSLTIAGFVLIFLELKDWSAEDNPHAILGCITTGLAFIQPFGAAFRPHPESRRRPIFNWLHWLVGNVAHILGIVTIFFATKLVKAKLPEWMDWILVGYVAFHVAVHLILSIASIASERNNGKRVNSFPMKEMTSSRSPLHSPERKQDSPHSCFRKFMLAIYILVILLLVATLIILIVFAPIEENWKKFENMISSSQNSSQEH